MTTAVVPMPPARGPRATPAPAVAIQGLTKTYRGGARGVDLEDVFLERYGDAG